jgi:ubiquinone/menaquinone biosynthesis C-methylase UbiE
LTHKDIFICSDNPSARLFVGEVALEKVSTTTLVAALKAAAEPTRLRILWLLRQGPLTVKDLTRILGQSQPRLSRHLKLLAEGNLVERAPEGSWVYFHLAEAGRRNGAAGALLEGLDETDPVLARDLQRLETIKRERDTAARTYFAHHAADWDRMRALHVDEALVEAAMRETIGNRPIDLLVDLGTGTGRTLELFADRFRRGIGFDLSPAMLTYARTKLAAAGIAHAQVRQGDMLALSLADGVADVVVMHQVLHFFADPEPCLAEAARILAPGGQLLIVDFAPHSLEFLREQHAHERLGISDAQVRQWLGPAGLTLTATRSLAPTENEASSQLTVTLWTATRPAVSNKARRSNTRLERV